MEVTICRFRVFKELYEVCIVGLGMAFKASVDEFWATEHCISRLERTNNTVQDLTTKAGETQRAVK